MNVFTYNGNQYQVSDGRFSGYKKAKHNSDSMYPGDNCMVPLCMRPELSSCAIAAGISEDIVFPSRKPVEVASKSKSKPRKAKKSKGPSISIF